MVRGVVTCSLVGVLSVPWSAHAQVSYRNIVTTLDEIPDGAGGEFNGVGPAVANDLGQVAFISSVSGVEDPYYGLWSEGQGTLSLVIPGDGAAPGFPGATLGNLRINGLDNTGALFFQGTMTGQGFVSRSRHGFWYAGAEGASLIVRGTDIAPGTGGVEFGDLLGETLEVNPAGQFAFHAELYGNQIDSRNDDGVWVGDTQGMSLLVRDGMVAPGTDGRVFTSVGVTPLGGGLQLSSGGDVVFHGVLEPGDIFDPHFGLWAARNGGIELVALNAQAAPGTNDTFNWNHNPFFSLRVNNNGDAAFSAFLSFNDYGIWAESDGALGLVALEGDVAPGLGGATFRNFNEGLEISDHGRTTFAASVTGGDLGSFTRDGIWAHQDGQLEQVVLHGEVAPGTGGARFYIDPFNGFAGNDLGQIAFAAELIGVDVGLTIHNRHGVWATDAEGELHLILRSGDVIDFDPDPLAEDLRLVPREAFDFDSLAERLEINNEGQVLIYSASGATAGWFMASLVDLAPGDVTGDGLVGVTDLDILLANWGDAVGVRAQASGDLSGDGFVGQDDLDLLIAHWGEGALPDVNIPEPGTLALLGVSIVGAMCRRRRPAASL